MKLGLRVIGLGAFAMALATAQNLPSPDAVKTLARISEATAIILSGEGAGRLTAIGTAVVIRPDGVLLTSYHGLKNAREVQVRLKNGEVFDHVTLIGLDERRDVACVRIAASKLPCLEPGTRQGVQPGEVAYAVTNSGGLNWSATQGIFSATRMADEVAVRVKATA
jgi:S1-C subfamily serine protease